MAKRIHLVYKEYFVGGFLIVATLTLAVLILATLSKNDLFEERYHLKAVYDTKSDLSVGAKIKISGMKVGEVTDLYFNSENKIEFVLEIQTKYQHMIRQNSVAQLFQERFPISDRIINITLGTEKFPALEDGMYIRTAEQLNLDTLVGRITGIVDNVGEIIARLNRGEGTAGKVLVDEGLYRDIRGITGTAGSAARNANNLLAQLNTTVAQVNQLIDTLKPIASSAKNGMQELPVLLSKVENLLDSVSLIISKAGGIADNVPGVINKGEDLMGNVDDVLGAVKKTWPISSKVEADPDDPPLFIEDK
jgi:phospholipid/cholesterol/gamma-HCH transport system substrate-binding protein